MALTPTDRQLVILSLRTLSFFGHGGRPGEVGGSVAAGAAVKEFAKKIPEADRKKILERPDGVVAEHWQTKLREVLVAKGIHPGVFVPRKFDLAAAIRTLGGPGSGDFGHEGRPGEKGGSAKGDEALVEKVKSDLREQFGREIALASIPADRLRKEIEESKKAKDDFVVVKIPSRSEFEMSMKEAEAVLAVLRSLGGPGSGFHGHAGRPGEIGGSAPGEGGGGAAVADKEYSGTAVDPSKPQSGFKPIPEADVHAAAAKLHITPAQLEKHAEEIRGRATTEAEKRHALSIAVGEIASQQVANSGTTADKYKDPKTGEYSAERQAEQDEIIERIFAAHEKEYGKRPEMGLDEPMITFLAGMPGAGKSTAVEQMDKRNTIKSDPDDVKKFMKEYKGFNAAEVADESGFIADKIMRIAFEQRMNVIIDGTAKTSGPIGGPPTLDDGLLGKLEQFKEAGFKTDLRFIDVTPDQSVTRVVDRYVQDFKKYVDSGYEDTKVPRWVPLDFIKNTLVDKQYGTKSSRSYELAKENARLNSYMKVDGWTGKVLERKGYD